MKRDDAVAIIKGRCSNRKGEDLDPQIVAEMQVQQIELETALVLPWFLLSEIATANTIAHEERLELPDLFIREPEEETALWYYKASDTDNPRKALTKDAYDKLVQQFPGEGEPKAYALVGPYFRLKPTPDKAYPIQMIYYKKDLPLTNNIENAWLKNAPDLLIAKTGCVIAGEYLKDMDAFALFSKQLDSASTRYATLWEARDHVGRDYTMGEKP